MAPSPLETLPCALPTSEIPESTDAAAVGASFVHNFGDLHDGHFTEKSLWRDSFALTGSLRTFYGPTAISTAWNETSSKAEPCSIALIPQACRVARVGPYSWVDVALSFETATKPQLLCTAILSLVPAADGNWKIWVMRTILDGLKGQPSVDVLEPVSSTNGTQKLTNGVVNGTSAQNGTSGHHTNSHSEHFDCVVVGGGQAGLSAAGRLKALGVSYILIDKNKGVGDSWGTRYDSARCKQPVL
jgi:hypothetical protein